MSVENLSKTVIDVGEEKLLTEISRYSVDSEKLLEFYCGIDCGSTQTRATLMPKDMLQNEDDYKKWFELSLVIPSISKTVPINATVKAHSNSLYDNMDSLFSINGEPSVRLVRGAKIHDVEGAQKELVSSQKKVTGEVILYNIVDAIGYGLVLHSEQTGEPLPGKVKLDLIIALPPDDLLDKEVRRLKQGLRRFSWQLLRRMETSIEVTVGILSTYAEPVAQVQAYYALRSEEMPEEVLLIESGGRNTSPTIYLDGRPVGAGLRSIDQSGTLLLDKIARSYMEEYGGKMPARRLLEHAVRTGQMKIGNEFRDITMLVKRCKDEVAEDLFQKVQSDILSKQSLVSMETLNVILLSGRVFQGGTYGYSVANRLERLIKGIARTVKVQVVEQNCIPQGLIFMYLVDNVIED